MNQLLENAVVERVYANRTMNGRSYYVLRLRDGNAVFAFNPSVVDGVKEGDILSLEVRKNGDYLHLVKVLNSSNGQAKQPAQATQPVQQVRSWEAERESIIRKVWPKALPFCFRTRM